MVRFRWKTQISNSLDPVNRCGNCCIHVIILKRQGIAVNGGAETCWKFDENAKWGEPVWGEIDTAIRHYDKLVVICSKDSLESPPVIREIERALQKEDREHKNVLFPVRIDDYLFDEWDHPRKADVVSKVIGDFSDNLATYAKAFPRFLDALNRPQQASKTG